MPEQAAEVRRTPGDRRDAIDPHAELRCQRVVEERDPAAGQGPQEVGGRARREVRAPDHGRQVRVPVERPRGHPGPPVGQRRRHGRRRPGLRGVRPERRLGLGQHRRGHRRAPFLVPPGSGSASITGSRRVGVPGNRGSTQSRGDRRERDGAMHVPIGRRRAVVRRAAAQDVRDRRRARRLPETPELAVGVREVTLDRPRAEPELVRDRLVVQAVEPPAAGRPAPVARAAPTGARPSRRLGPPVGSRNAGPRRRTSPMPARRRAGCGSRCRARPGERRGSGRRPSIALSNVVARSPIAWRISVGAVIRGISSSMSTAWRPSRLATAFCGDVDIRWRSSNQRICSSSASGMKIR